jgi:hypothetical protein
MNSRTTWRKSTRSNDTQSCVEVADHAVGQTLVRDTKLAEQSPILAFPNLAWRVFVDSIKQERGL